jgi:predicted negative regulator of RcsB-dependent stress response
LTSGKISYKFLFILGSLAILSGCSVEKNTGTSRFYQGLTSKFNIYFNGNESFKAGVAKVNAGYRDDFSDLLKIFEYSDPASPSVCSANMVRAIQKASKIIQLKSITAKPEIKKNTIPNEKEEEFMNRKEYNEWVDDCYLLIGKARVYIHDFEQAKTTLGYNISTTVDNKIKNESTIWLARIYNETGNYNESFRILSELNISKDFTRDLLALYYTTFADLFVKQKKYQEVIEPLGKALGYVSGKRNRYRLTYLLAQLCEKTGDGKRATSLYRAVVNMNSPYEVEFNARINLAGVFDVNSGNPDYIKRELEKMLRDTKNKEFRDQIYFALGNLAKKEGKENDAVDYYKKSVASSRQNPNQKGKSFLALALYYYSKPDYMNSGKYYDSTIYFLDQKYPDYQNIKAKAQNLNALVKQLTIIQREDSLQHVAKLTESERNSLIAAIIEKVKKEETEKKSIVQNTDRYNMGQYYENERRSQENITQEGKWYFYNQSAMTFGRTEFRRRWGDRKLEDNWRRLNKSRVTTELISGNQEENNQVRKDTSVAVNDNKNPKFYLRNLPMTDSLITVSNEKIANAYLESGKIYDERISDKPKAIESFETLLKRFPGNELEPEALYYIYRVYKEDNDPKSEAYRQILLEKHASNEFTRIISDPDYSKKKLDDLKKAEKLYQEAYNAYATEDFTGSIALCDSAVKQYSKHELAPKFLLLHAYCTARISDERTFKAELDKLIKQWPATPETVRASEIKAYLNEKIPELKVEEDKQIASEIYVTDSTSQHVFALIVMNPSFNINQVTFDVISYNIDIYTNKNYHTEGALIENKYIMITVSGFSDKATAMEYYRSFRPDKIVRNPSGSPLMTFIIGKKNLETLGKDKNPERYRLFFTEKYLNRGSNK